MSYIWATRDGNSDPFNLSCFVSDLKFVLFFSLLLIFGKLHLNHYKTFHPSFSYFVIQKCAFFSLFSIIFWTGATCKFYNFSLLIDYVKYLIYLHFYIVPFLIFIFLCVSLFTKFSEETNFCVWNFEGERNCIVNKFCIA